MKRKRHCGKVKANLDANRERVKNELFGHEWGDTKKLSYWGKSRSKSNVRRLFKEFHSLRKLRDKPAITRENIIEFESFVRACFESLASCKFIVLHNPFSGYYGSVSISIGSLSNDIPYRSKTIIRVLCVNEIKYIVRVLTRGTGHQLNQSLFKERLGLNLLAPRGDQWNQNIGVGTIQGLVMCQEGAFIW